MTEKNPENEDEETYHHEDTRVVITTNAVRRIRKNIEDEDDYERKQREGHFELGGSD